MNMSAINEARMPFYGRRLAMACGAVLGAMIMVGPALGADLPYNNYYPNNYYPNDYSYPNYSQQNCCGYYPPPCCCCEHEAGPPPEVNIHVNVPPPWERRQGGWVTRKYTERRYSDDSPYPEVRQYRSVQRYEDEDYDRLGPYSAAAFERREAYREAYRYEAGTLPRPWPPYDEPPLPPAPVPGW